MPGTGNYQLLMIHQLVGIVWCTPSTRHLSIMAPILYMFIYSSRVFDQSPIALRMFADVRVYNTPYHNNIIISIVGQLSWIVSIDSETRTPVSQILSEVS